MFDMDVRKLPSCLSRVAVLLALPTALLFSDSIEANVGAQLPNIVYIIADDQTYSDFGFMGNDTVKTPNLDELANQSLVYTNGYVPSSVCRPSLATMLMGTYPHQNGIYYNHSPPGWKGFGAVSSVEEYNRLREIPFANIKSKPTLPRILKELGYRSFQSGKFWEGHYSNAGFTHGMTVYEPVPGLEYANRKLSNGDVVGQGNGDYGLKIGRLTMQPLWDFLSSGEESPYFIWFAPFMPHLPHDAPEEFMALYEGNMDVSEKDIRYYASVSWFDDVVGQLLDKLEAEGELENTMIVFASDNGWTAGNGKYSSGDYKQTNTSKRSPFEDGVRTPILFRYDGVISPDIRSELVSTVDMMPSVLKQVVETTFNLPGMDIINEPPGKDRAVFGEIYPGNASAFNAPEKDIAYRWVRQGEFKLIKIHKHEKTNPWNSYLHEDALFNVKEDPQEKINLFKHPEYLSTRNRLLGLLGDWWAPEEL